MESSYDENIEENAFFKTLRNEYEPVFRRAVSENWTICVPSSESLDNYELNQHNIFAHVLIPSDELPSTHFRNLNQEELRIYDRLVKLQESQSVPILFSEVFYVDATRYDVLCLEYPLNYARTSQKFNPRLYSVKNLRDCVDLLRHESTKECVLKKLDEVIKQFLFLSSKNYFHQSLHQQIEFVREIYRRCLQITLEDRKLRTKMQTNHVFTENVKAAVESYVLHNIYSIIMKGIITNMTEEIGQFNKTLRNLANIQLQHLKVTDSSFDSILKARNELSRFNNFNTILGKLSCFKRCINHLSNRSPDKLSVDDLLPILVFLVVKSGITTWIAQLEYVKQFNFSHNMNGNYGNESSFLVTTLEAIITFIKSGLFYKSVYSSELNLIKSLDGETDVCTYICAKSKHFWKSKHVLLLKLFQYIYNDDLPSISNLLDDQKKSIPAAREAQYCHPLCSCDRCEKLFANSEEASTLTANSVNELGYSPLHVAACYGKCNIVDWLLSKGANPNSTDFSGSTPLHCAAQHGYQNTVLLLIYAEAKLDPKDDEGYQPLHFAAVNGHVDCVKALLYFAEQARIAIDVSATNKDGDTPLHLAVKYYQKEIAEILLNYNANPSLKNKHGNTVFELTESLSIKTLLNEKYDSVNLLTNSATVSKPEVFRTKKRLPDDEFGEESRTVEAAKLSNLLFKAAKNNDIATMKRYLGFGRRSSVAEDVDSTVRYKCHPLCRCEKCYANSSTGREEEGDMDGVKMSAAINPNTCDSDGFTALHIACKYGRNEAIQFLLDMGAKINVRTYKQLLTPLHIVCIQNQLNSARILLQENSCKVNLRDRNGNTALHYACMADNLRIVELLLQYEPDLNIRNDRGKTCLNEAEESLSYSVMRVLKLKAYKPSLKEELLW